MSGEDQHKGRSGPEPSIACGALISHYRIIEAIGAGGMGEVYLAEDTDLNRKVALKFLPPDLCRDADCRARFKREAQAAAKLSHPNIVTIYEVAEYRERPYIVMEYLQGKSLKEIIQAGDIPPAKAIDLAIQIAEGLNAAHQAGVIHRDVKPANIVIGDDGRAKILDFGLATIRGAERLTQTGSTLGTLGYMSPEQTRGEATDQRSDIFSFGVILYEMITGRPPFRGDHEAAILYAIAYEEPEPLVRYKAGVPDALQRIVSKVLAKSPNERYQHTDDLLCDLRTYSKEKLSTPGEKPPRDLWNKYVVTSAVAIILMVAGYLIVSTYHLREDRKAESTRKMLAVLPFENLGSPNDEYFADGITDEITAKLASIRDLGVISRTSTMQYKKTSKNLKQIARELGVDYILEGTIRWDKGVDTSRVRILPQLIRVSDDTHLWAETYERPLTSIFAIQTEIASRIAETMDFALRQPDNRALQSLPTDNLEAYQAYLRGMDFNWRGMVSREVCEMAVQMFQRAVALDSTFALAYARLSVAHAGMYAWGYNRTPERSARSREAAERAISLQPDLPDAHSALGVYYYYCLRDYDTALRELAFAEVGLPNNPEVMSYQGYIMRRQGKFRAALEKQKRAFSVSPRDHKLANEIGWTHLVLREYSSAEQYLKQANALSPDFRENYINMASLYYSWRADTGSARAALAMCPIQDDDYLRWYWFRLHVYERKYQAALDVAAAMSYVENDDGERVIPKTLLSGIIYELEGESVRAGACWDSSRTILEQVVNELPEEHSLHSALGLAYAGLGRREDAIREGRLGVDLCTIQKDAIDGPRRLEDLAVIYVMVGEDDAALDQIEHLLSIPCKFSIPLLQLDPHYDPLRKLPRYQKLMEKYGP